MTIVRKPADPLALPYQPTPAERVAVDSHLAKRAHKVPSPRLKLEKEGHELRVSNDHASRSLGDVLIMEALATTDWHFAEGIVNAIAYLSSTGQKFDARSTHFALSIINGIEPRNEVETLLASQMAAVHMATMNAALRVGNATNLPQYDSAVQGFNKLARTFAMQLEALKRHRSNGEQKVTVQHVHVNEGGQAIVGTVSGVAGAGGIAGKREPTP